MKKFCKGVWWGWGVPIVISFFSMGLFADSIKQTALEDGMIERMVPFFITVLVSYWAGMTFKKFL